MNSIGTTRRLQALATRGFGVDWVSEHTGIDTRVIREVRAGSTRIVSDDTHQRVKSLMQESLLRSDPTGGDADQTRELAESLDWKPFGVWSDLDDPQCEPEPNDGSMEQEDAVRKLRMLHARGFSISSLSREMNINRSTLGRILDNRHPVDGDLCVQILDSYDRLELLPDPEGYGASRSRRTAERRGWVVYS